MRLVVRFCIGLVLSSVVSHAAYFATAKFSLSDTTWRKLNGFDVVELKGCNLAKDSASMPSLPRCGVRILIPQDMKVASVSVSCTTATTLEDSFCIAPTQPPHLTDGSLPSAWVGPDSATYASPGPCPGPILVQEETSYEFGYKIATIAVNPFQFYPSTGRLRLYTHVAFSLSLAADSNRTLPVTRRGELAQSQVEKYVRAIVANPEELSGYLGDGFTVVKEKGEPSRFAFTELPSVQGHPVDYVIITSEALRDSFQRLADWKTQKGVVTQIRTVPWIETHCTGIDAQEKIRNFIRDAYSKWGAVYVLLGGDRDNVPVRTTSAGESEPDDFTTDLYYAGCAEGNWDGNHNGILGEDDADGTDYAGDVWLGRAPVRTPADVGVFTSKVLEYEQDPQTQYMGRALLMASSGFEGEMGDIDGALQYWGIPTSKLYSAGPCDDRLTRTHALNYMKQGYHMMFHCDHSGPYDIGTGNQDPEVPGTEKMLATQDAARMDPAFRTAILWSCGCSPNRFDTRCVTEEFMLNPHAGMVAVVANTRVGLSGQCEDQGVPFINALLDHEDTLHHHLGEAFLWSQWIGADPPDRFHAKEYNLLGDPELPPWTAQSIGSLALGTEPDTLVLGPQQVVVHVSADGQDASGAVVCVMKDTEAYAVGVTGQYGNCVFDNYQPETPGQVTVTATKTNCLYAQQQIPVVAAGSPYLHFMSFTVDDDDDGSSVGNGDFVVNPGETLELRISLENTGGATAHNVTATLTSGCGDVTIISGTEGYEDIPPGQSRQDTTPFLFTLLPTHPNDTAEITLDLAITGTEGAWGDEFRVPVLHDSLFQIAHRLTVILAAPDPDTIIIDSIVVANYGWGAGDSIHATLTTTSGNINILDGYAYFDEIPGLGRTAVWDSLVFTVAQGDARPAGGGETLALHDRFGRAQNWRWAFDWTPPSPVEGLTVVETGPDFVDFRWQPSEDLDVRGYHVYRASSPGGPYTTVSDKIIDSIPRFRDTTDQPRTRYYYAVRAVDESGNLSDLSSELSVMTSPPYCTGWPTKMAARRGGVSACVVGDISPESGVEVAATSCDSVYVWNSAGALLTGWPRGMPGSLASFPPVLADLDGDGYMEVIAACAYRDTADTLPAGQYGGIYAWRYDDAVLWQRDFDGPVVDAPAVADVDNNGVPDIIAMEWGNWIHVLSGDGNGEVSVNWPVQTPGGGGGTPVVADFDGDLMPEVVAVTRDGGGYIRVDLYENTGQLTSDSWIPSSCPDRINSPTAGDIDGDGSLDVLFSTWAGVGNKLYAFSPQRGLLWQVDLAGGATSPPVLADLGPPDSLEVLVALAGGRLEVRDCSGGLLWYRTTEGTWAKSGPVVADIDGDGQSEVVQGFSWPIRHGNLLCAYEANGDEYSDGFPIYLPDDIVSTPSIADLDLDGNAEMFLASPDAQRAYAWRLESSCRPRPDEWGAGGHDCRNTRLYAQPVGHVLCSAGHDLYWWGRYKLWGDLEVADHSLTVQPGTWVQAVYDTAGKGITVRGGSLTATGTRSAPTYFEPEEVGQIWDGLRVDSGCAAVVGCNIAGASEGLAVTDCASLEASGDRFTDCCPVGAITSIRTPTSVVESCGFTGNGCYDVFVSNVTAASCPCVIAGNEFSNSADYGIWIEGTPAAVIAGNRLVNSRPTSAYGVHCWWISGVPPQPLGDIVGNTICGYGQGGIDCGASSPRIYGHNEIEGNCGIGLCCLQGACPAVESCVIADHNYGVVAGYESYPDLGTMLVPMVSGYNTIDNSVLNVANFNLSQIQPVMARLNWWGQSPPDPLKFDGNVDYVPWLTEEPGEGGQWQPSALDFPLALGQYRPNPFSSATRVMLSNPRQQRLVVRIYDVTGRHVQTLLNAEAPPGRSWLTWDGLDVKGRKVGSGVYFCRLSAANEDKVSRVVYVRGK